MPDYSDYFVCPNCGSDVPPKALACPDCGSDDDTGWSEDTMYDGLDLPEFEPPEELPATSLFQNKFFLCVIAVIVLMVFICLYLL